MKIKDIPAGKTFRYQGKRYTRVDVGDTACGLLGHTVVPFDGEQAQPKEVTFQLLRPGDWCFYQGELCQRISWIKAYNAAGLGITRIPLNAPVTPVTFKPEAQYED